MTYLCDGCGARRVPDGDWRALRIASDRRGLEVRRFEDAGPDDRFVCSDACAARRISEILGGARPAAGPAS